MKRIVCEMCGSSALIKHDGIFECQSCGTKYSVEEAKKMMIEGPVDVSGSTVRIDNSSSIDNYYKMADSAFISNNNREAENYCNKIIEIDANNYKAWYLKGKAAGWQSTLANNRIDEAINCFVKSLDNAPNEDLSNQKLEVATAIETLTTGLIKLWCDHFAEFPSLDNVQKIVDYLGRENYYALQLLTKCDVALDGINKTTSTIINNGAMDAWNNKIWNDYWGEGHPTKYELSRFIEQSNAVVILLLAAANLFYKDRILYENIIAVDTKLINAWSYTYQNGTYVKESSLAVNVKQEKINQIMDCHQKIKSIDPSYVIPRRPSVQNGCYIATAVYGSYDCPEVWTLRRFRDYKLATTWYGRLFIYTYYAISPTLVRLFGRKKWFKKIWKSKLDAMVNKLQSDGYESTKYNDYNW